MAFDQDGVQVVANAEGNAQGNSSQVSGGLAGRWGCGKVGGHFGRTLNMACGRSIQKGDDLLLNMQANK
jgi:hypothetical protein